MDYRTARAAQQRALYGLTLGLALSLALVGACSSSSTGTKTGTNAADEDADKTPKDDRAEAHFSLFVTTELRGQIEPCGCNTNPLGDLARTVELVQNTRASGTPALVVDGGSLLFSAVPVPPHLEAQETLKAALLVDTFRDQLEVAAVGLGPLDLGRGPDAITLPRHAANLAPDSGVPLAEPEIVEVAGVKVGLFGVTAPAALAPVGLTASDPIAAAKTAIAGLDERGAELIVGIAHLTRRDAAALAREATGIDILVVGQNAPFEPDQVSQDPQRVGDTYLVRPANRGQIVTRLDITVRPAAEGQSDALADAIGLHRASLEIAAIAKQSDELKKSLAGWRDDPSADQSFIQAKERELAALTERQVSLRASPLQIPEHGSYLVMTQVEISRGLDCNQAVQTAKADYNRKAGQANLAAAKDIKPPPVADGQAGYVGAEECSMCHGEATAFWQNSKHYQAWETLEAVDKQFDYECISCHVTGWEQPGGSTLSVNEPLRDVQCEVCHGPGSLHVDNDGEEKTSSLTRLPPEATCVGCHNQEHSDTFNYSAYLRDVTGPGHGEAFRKSLGDGPTGHELRQAGLAKAGATLGKGCLK